MKKIQSLALFLLAVGMYSCSSDSEATSEEPQINQDSLATVDSLNAELARQDSMRIQDSITNAQQLEAARNRSSAAPAPAPRRNSSSSSSSRKTASKPAEKPAKPTPAPSNPKEDRFNGNSSGKKPVTAEDTKKKADRFDGNSSGKKEVTPEDTKKKASRFE